MRRAASCRWFRAAALSVLALIAVAPVAVAQEKKSGRKPNVIVIVADDLGWADLGCQGCKDVPTPNIDSLAKNGVRCTNGYVSCPYCSPTRAGLLTGRYQNRFGHEFNPGPATTAPKNFGLPLTETTLADLLKALGYVTGLVGKWHLGYEAMFHPQQRGFDEFFGFLGGAHSYLDAKADSANPILRGTKVVNEKAYLTDAFTREAVDFIDRHKKEPFLLVLTYNAVHGPMHKAEKYDAKFAGIDDAKRRTFATMLTALDEGVGAVLARLRQHGIEEDTLIVFISDNGGPTAVNSSRNTPLRGFKAQVWEGGVRIPFLLQWKGRLPAGKTYDQPVIALDILPTALAAAGGKAPEKNKLDGVDLLPYLTGKASGAPHDILLWRFGAQWAVRKGDWKLTHFGGELHLANLATDIGQAKDVKAMHPDVVKEMEAAYQKWNAELVPPRWKEKKANKDKKKDKGDEAQSRLPGNPVERVPNPFLHRGADEAPILTRRDRNLLAEEVQR
jgi:arylsulfatase A-like enzyme